MTNVPTSPIEVLENRGGKVKVRWPFDRSGDVRKFNLYYHPRKQDSPLLLEGGIPNARAAYRTNYVEYVIDRADVLGINPEDNFYLQFTTVDWAGNEGAFDDSRIKIVYPNGVLLSNSHVLSDVDRQVGVAVNADFTTSDRFYGVLESVYIGKDTTAPIDYVVSMIPFPDLPANSEIILASGTADTRLGIPVELRPSTPQLDGRDVRVQVTGVTGAGVGSLSVMVNRKRLFTPFETW